MSLQTTSAPAGGGTSEDHHGESFWHRVVHMQAFQILLVLIVIVAVFATLAPISFANIGNARLIAQNASILAILGVGMTFVIVTSGIDLSIGSVMVFSGVVAAKAMQAISACRCRPVHERPSKWPSPSSCFSCWCACSQTQRALIAAASARSGVSGGRLLRWYLRSPPGRSSPTSQASAPGR